MYPLKASDSRRQEYLGNPGEQCSSVSLGCHHLHILSRPPQCCGTGRTRGIQDTLARLGMALEEVPSQGRKSSSHQHFHRFSRAKISQLSCPVPKGVLQRWKALETLAEHSQIHPGPSHPQDLMKQADGQFRKRLPEDCCPMASAWLMTHFQSAFHLPSIQYPLTLQRQASTPVYDVSQQLVSLPGYGGAHSPVRCCSMRPQPGANCSQSRPHTKDNRTKLQRVVKRLQRFKS